MILRPPGAAGRFQLRSQFSQCHPNRRQGQEMVPAGCHLQLVSVLSFCLWWLYQLTAGLRWGFLGGDTMCETLCAHLSSYNCSAVLKVNIGLLRKGIPTGWPGRAIKYWSSSQVLHLLPMASLQGVKSTAGHRLSPSAILLWSCFSWLPTCAGLCPSLPAPAVPMAHLGGLCGSAMVPL